MKNCFSILVILMYFVKFLRITLVPYSSKVFPNKTRFKTGFILVFEQQLQKKWINDSVLIVSLCRNVVYSVFLTNTAKFENRFHHLFEMFADSVVQHSS